MIYTMKLKTLLIIMLTMIITMVAVLTATHAIPASTDNWGLSFREDNKPPEGNETAARLKQFDAYYIGDTSGSDIYLTFDAGYENGNTEKILDTLKKHNVKAAFFLVGNYIETEPDLVIRMKNEGHIVANHTFSHPDMSAIADKESFKNELESLEKLYKKTTGDDMLKFYRPPQGKYNEDNLKAAQKLGYKTFFWSLAYVDWYENDQPSHDEAMEKLTSRIHPGAIVLLHSTSETNAGVLDTLLSEWKKMGYTFGTIDNLK